MIKETLISGCFCDKSHYISAFYRKNPISSEHPKAYFVIQTTLYMDATYRVTYLYEYDTDTYFCATEGYGGMQNIYRDS